MKIINYTITFLEYWQVSSGLGIGSAADSECLKDRYGLPYIPGKTLKGLWRDAFLFSGQEKNIAQYFGKDAEEIVKNDKKSENQKDPIIALQNKNSEPGRARWSNATLSSALIHELKDKNELKAQFYTSVTSTAINENGIAKAKSLRTAQVCLPITLLGEIVLPDGKDNAADLFIKAAPWLRRMGMGRNRGFGRCIVKIETK
ncbi:MAG TPA: RAMP superfamily CRISPR-associated protein [Saprospiraceae bacterium]|nr:RAMP superfamily CRISPR-associated protein [Saprospiraceae bacterium]